MAGINLRQWAREEIERKRAAQQQQINDVAERLIESAREPLTLQTDTQGSPSETVNWSQLRAVLDARQREL